MIRIRREGWVCLAAALGLRAAGVPDPPAAARSREQDQWTVSAGLRWDFAPSADLKVQVDRVRDHNATVPWVAGQPGWDGKATVYSIVLDFIFGGAR